MYLYENCGGELCVKTKYEELEECKDCATYLGYYNFEDEGYIVKFFESYSGYYIEYLIQKLLSWNVNPKKIYHALIERTYDIQKILREHDDEMDKLEQEYGF